MDHLIKNKINHPRICPRPPALALRSLVLGAPGMGEVQLITGCGCAGAGSSPRPAALHTLWRRHSSDRYLWQTDTREFPTRSLSPGYEY